MFQVTMVTLDPIVQIARAAMLDATENCTERWWVALGLVRRDPLRPHAGLVNRTLEERLRRFGVPPLRKVGVNDLPILVDRPVDVGPFPVETTIGLIDLPFSTNWTSMLTGSVSEERQKPLDPAIDGAAVNNKTTFCKPLHDIGIAQAVPDVPAYRQGNHIIGKAMVREGAR